MTTKAVWLVKFSTKLKLKSPSKKYKYCLDTGVTAACRLLPLTSTQVEMLIVTAAEWVVDGERQQRAKRFLPIAKYDMNDNNC